MLKDILERLYAKYNHKRFIPPDPLQFVYKYDEVSDMEIAGLLAAVLAYGRVGQIEKSVTKLLKFMGNSPYKFVMNFNSNSRDTLRGFKHRFTTGDDISDLLGLLKGVLGEYGCIEQFFLAGYDDDIVAGLSSFLR